MPPLHRMIFRDSPPPACDLDLDREYTLGGLQTTGLITIFPAGIGFVFIRTKPDRLCRLGGKLYAGSLYLEESISDRVATKIYPHYWAGAVTLAEWEIDRELLARRDALIAEGADKDFVHWAYQALLESFTPVKSARAKRSNARAWLQIAAAGLGKSERFF